MRHPIGLVKHGLLALVLLVSAFAGIATFGTAPATAQDIETRVMWLHAGPSTGKVEVFIDNDEVLDEFEYGDLSDWIEFAPGAPRVTITADRAGFNYAIFDAVYPVPAGNDYHAIITDVLILTGVVDRSPIPDRGARVRIVQASVDTPEVNVVAASDNSNLATQLAYSRTSEYVEVPAGSFEVAVNIASSGENALTQTVELEGDMVYDLVLMGTPGDDDKPLTFTLMGDTTTERGTEESTPST
jgi:hypothetical protein